MWIIGSPQHVCFVRAGQSLRMEVVVFRPHLVLTLCLWTVHGIGLLED